jgi:uncharacterized DUF497 family protein
VKSKDDKVESRGLPISKAETVIFRRVTMISGSSRENGADRIVSIKDAYGALTADVCFVYEECGGRL